MFCTSVGKFFFVVVMYVFSNSPPKIGILLCYIYGCIADCNVCCFINVVANMLIRVTEFSLVPTF
jgi:hypothetical protein